jgi:zinc transport system ATP-binding protein
MTDEVVVEFRSVGFTYGDAPILNNVSLAVRSREFVSVVGPNGSGKTTLIKMILGLVKPTTGEVRVFGKAPHQVRTRVGYMPQSARLDPKFPATVLDVVLMGRLGVGAPFGPYNAADRVAARAALERVELWEIRTRPLSELSGGQRQRVLIARALAGEPELLVLDEPTANLDTRAETKLYELLEELNRERTIIIVSHDMGFVSRVVKTVVCVKCDAEVHPTSELSSGVVHNVYGDDVRMIRHDHRCASEGHKCKNS